MSDYPVSIDDILEPDYALGLGASNPTHPEQHTLFAEILAALEAKVGTNNSPDPTSIDSLLKNTTVGHHHDGIDSRAVAVGGGAHPDLATHDALGLATDAELAAHAGAADPHAGYELESAHTKAAHDALALSHDSLADVSIDDHHARDHHARHEPGGADAMAVDAAAATASLRTLGVGAAQAAAGNDSRLSDARTPTAHETTHRSGGSDPLSHDNIAGVSADDHHNESHAARHADGGADEVVDAGQSVSTQAFGDAASVGADTAKAAPVLHKHAMPANPVTAHEAAADPHTGYVQESLVDAKGDLLTATADNTPARLAVGAAGTILGSDGQVATGLGWITPWWNYDAPSGALAQTTQRLFTSAADLAALTTQRPYLTAVYLHSNVTITSISYRSRTTALVGGNHQQFGLYDSSRNLLRATTDDTSTAWGTNATKTLSLTSTFTTTYAGLYYVGILVDATTPPSLIGTSLSANQLIALAPILNGITADTGQTSLPNPAGAMTQNSLIPYVWLS